MSDSIGEVISLAQRRAWPQCKTLGDLVDVAERVPPKQIVPLVMSELHELSRLNQAGQLSGPALLRHAIVVGALTTRLAFKVHGVPEERDSPIAAA